MPIRFSTFIVCMGSAILLYSAISLYFVSTPILAGTAFATNAAVTQEAMNHGKTVIFMVDSRPFTDINNATQFANDTSAYPFHSISANINRIYACVHGYDFRVVSAADLILRNGKEYVPHPITGKHASQWMKVPASKELLGQGYSTVIFLDSDAVFTSLSNSWEDITEIVQNHSIPWTKYTKIRKDYFTVNGTWPATPVADASMIVATDWNKHMFRIRGTNANTGVLVFRNHPITHELLKVWWNTNIDERRWNTAFDFDQYVFNHVIVPNSTFRSVVSKISDHLINHNGEHIYHRTAAKKHLTSYHNIADPILLSFLKHIKNNSMQCPSISDSSISLNFTALTTEHFL